jgi:hypothetical protein
LAEYYILEVKMERERKNKQILFFARGNPEIKSKEDFAIDLDILCAWFGEGLVILEVL